MLTRESPQRNNTKVITLRRPFATSAATQMRNATRKQNSLLPTPAFVPFLKKYSLFKRANGNGSGMVR